MEAFISYRRATGAIYAKRIKDFFSENGVEVFLDTENLKDYTGYFSGRLKEEIEGAENFILILSGGALEKEVREGDVLVEEILYAKELRKTVIPVLCGGFSYADLSHLPAELSFLAGLECLEIRDMQDFESRFFPSLTRKMVQSPAIRDLYLRQTSRTLLSSRSQVEKKVTFADRFTEDATEVCLCAVVANGLLNSASEYFHRLAAAGCRFRVVVNDPECEAFSEACRNRFGYSRVKKSMGYSAVEDLGDWQAEYPDCFTGRTTELFLTAAIFLVRYRNEEKSTVKVDYYDFDCPDSQRRSVYIPWTDRDNFEFYARQFEWIWERSHPIADTEE